MCFGGGRSLLFHGLIAAGGFLSLGPTTVAACWGVRDQLRGPALLLARIRVVWRWWVEAVVWRVDEDSALKEDVRKARLVEVGETVLMGEGRLSGTDRRAASTMQAMGLVLGVLGMLDGIEMRHVAVSDRGRGMWLWVAAAAAVVGAAAAGAGAGVEAA